VQDDLSWLTADVLARLCNLAPGRIRSTPVAGGGLP
jgi:hypothetical protein